MRFIRFNGVGAIGFAVQLAVLAILLRAGAHYLAATAIAVEASVLNNFLWHERWTWRDRPAAGRERAARLWRFHLLNGLVSLGGNVAITWVLADGLGVSPVAGNVAAVLMCGLLNFYGSNRLVFHI